MKSIGLMSGTSMDGIDVALLENDGEGYVRPLGGESFPYLDEDRTLIAKALDEARSMQSREERLGVLARAEALITQRHVEAVQSFMNRLGIGRSDIRVVGFHGQTILHRPEKHLTVQLGDGGVMASHLGVDVVFDFRASDVEAGGEGAPFVPVYHKALVQNAGLELPVVVVNIGGVGNVTWIGRNDEILAFDTGPGNALIDDWVSRCSGKAFDEGGELSMSGQLNEDALAALLDNAYFKAPPPKSLDRNDFSLEAVQGLTVEDGAATLARFTAETIAAAAVFMPEVPKQWIVCGGGVKNGAIMQGLGELCGGEVISADKLGWNTDLIEAEAFAYLAVRSLKGLPLTFPGTTGVPAPQGGGRLASANSSAN